MNELFGYEGKVCVVTGSASGMGRATCELLVKLGAEVYGLDRNELKIPGMRAFIRCDLSDKESIDAAMAELPERIDRFFGVAGLSGLTTDFKTTFTVDFIANKYITDAYLDERMPEGGAIVYVTSCGGLMWEKYQDEYKGIMDCATWDEMIAFMREISPDDGFGALAYGLSKRAMNYYTSLKAVQWGERNIRVNAVLPGSTDTGMKAEFEQMAGGEENLKKENGAIGRLATSEEMAEPIVFLNSDMARFVSGLMMIVDMGHNSEKVLGFSPNQLDTPMRMPVQQ